MENKLQPPKPFIKLTLQPDGSIEFESNVADQNVVRQALKLTEERIIASALAMVTEQNKKIVVPVSIMPGALRKTN